MYKRQHRLPVVSGAVMHIKKTEDGFVLKKLTIDGREPAGDEVFSLVNATRGGADINKNLRYAGAVNASRP